MKKLSEIAIGLAERMDAPWTGKCKDCNKIYQFYSLRDFSKNVEELESMSCRECDKIKEELREKAHRAIEWMGICPVIYRTNDISLLPDDAARESFQKVQDIKFTTKGLVLYGSTRRGKTRAAWERLKKAYVNHGVIPKTFSCGEFSVKVASAFGNNYGEEFIDELCTTKIILFDDIGQIVFTDRVQECLFMILEHRMMNQRPIIFTTNDVGETLESKFSSNRGEAFVARLKEFCEIIKF